MKSGSGFLLVFVGLVLLWMAVTGRLACLSSFMQCVTGGASTTPPTTGSSGGSGFSLPSLPSLPKLGGV